MMRRLALAIALACLTTPALADFRADYTGGSNGDTPSMSRFEVGGHQLRMDAGKVSMLIDADSGKMIVLMHDKKTYMDMAKVAEMAGAAMAKANAALANLPPEQRAMVEQRMHGAMGGGGGAKVDVQVAPTGASDRVGQWPCQVYSTSVNGRHIEDSCLADSSAAGISAADRATVHKAFDQIRTMSEKMSAGMFKSPLNQLPEGKFPVKITHYGDSGTQTVTLSGISEGGVNASEFAIPAGYTEQEPEMHGPPGRRH